jgi:hypothetical protein
VTLARRLAKLEASRSPTDVVLAWLAEAQEWPTVPAYLATLVDLPPEAWPLGRLAEGVEASVRASTEGTPDEVWQAVRWAVGDAWFLLELVLALNLAARQIRDIEGLRWALLTKWLGLLAAEAELAERTRLGDPAHAAREAQDWRDLLAFSLTTLSSEDAARVTLERRYFDGQPVLFPALAREWADLVERLEWLVAHADRLPELRAAGEDGLGLEVLRAGAAEGALARASELIDSARIEALTMLGERERAAAIIEQRLSAPVASTPGTTSADGRDGNAA